MIYSNNTSFLPYPCYRPSGSSSTVGCNGVARSIGSLSSLSSPNTSFSEGAGAGAGRDPSISRSAASRALDAASSARNLQPETNIPPQLISQESQTDWMEEVN